MVMLMAYHDVRILLNIVTVMKRVQLWNHCHAKAMISALIYTEADVDDVVPLAIRRVSPRDDTDWDDIISSDCSDQPEGAIWLPSYPPEELCKFQQDDPDLS